MSTSQPQIIEESNLSHAWGRVFLHVMDTNQSHLAPLTVSVTGFVNGLPQEDDDVRRSLDSLLANKGKKFSSKVSALTIFPNDAWLRRGCQPVSEFSTWYLENLFPRLKARDSHNSRGTYFERMVRFVGSKPNKHSVPEIEVKNQLQHVVEVWRRDRNQGRSPRHSALQVSVFDPAKDHTGGVMLGFPCLHQVGFAYDKDQLAVSAYYPTQYIMDRAYGNYLGLCHLGRFMAREMGLTLVRMNCFIGLPKLGNDWGKRELAPFAETIRSRLPHHNA